MESGQGWWGALGSATVSACPTCATEATEAARFCGSCGAILSTSAPTDDPWLGRIVDRRYKVLSRLGAGGMGVVYRVEHLRLEKTAAMKVLSPEVARRDEMVQRFRLEARAVSKLNHPNIVQTFDFGQFDDSLYLIMEYVKGDDLAAVLKSEGPLPLDRAARLFVQACSALTEAHDQGIIHRDLKPENLMVHRRRDGSEHLKVLDFGLAKLRELDESAAVTSGKQILGTPYYMAPEQVRGEALDPRADVYSLGATMYRVLTGAPPFNAPSPMGVLAKHITDAVTPPSVKAPERGLPPEADEIVLRAMAKNLSDRYESAAAIQRDLERIVGGAVSVSTAPPPRGRITAVGEAPTLALSDSEVGSDSGNADEGLRLRRQDLEEFERRLRRGRLVTRLALPVGIVAVAAGVFGISRWRAERPTSSEREPNNTPGYANLLASGRPVRGALGAPGDSAHGDVDYYRVPIGKGARAVRVRLEGIPGTDLILELFDAQGRRIAKGSAHGRGGGEWIQPFSIGPAEAFIAVREVWVEGQKPTQDLSDTYGLTASWGPPAGGWEIEPNDWTAAATPVTPGASVRGYLGEADDKDWFSITPTANGRLAIRVAVPAGVDVVLLHDTGGKGSTNEHGSGEDETATWDAHEGKPILVGVARKPPEKGAEVTGLDAPYELSVSSDDGSKGR